MRLRIHPLFYLYIGSVMLLSSAMDGLAAIAALAIHEAAHAAAAWFAGEPIERTEITPFGGVMLYKPGKTPSNGVRGLAVALSGPLSNYLSLIFLTKMGNAASAGTEVIVALMQPHAAMLALNLLPVLPLDGGRAVFSLCYYLMDAGRAIVLLTAAGFAAGLLIMAMSFYGLMVLGVLNLSLFLVGCYVAVYALKTRETMAAENAWAILHDRQNREYRPGKARVIWAGRDVLLCRLIGKLAPSCKTFFILDTDHGIVLISEDTVVKTLLENPAAKMNDCAVHQEYKKQRAENLLLSLHDDKSCDTIEK